jgi:3D (Asp-Asp-Asp) domain-containing protein
MKWIIVLISVMVLSAGHAFAREEFVLARITGYWRAEGCGQIGGWSGTRLQPGDCAVDPKRIPFGSKIVFPDKECWAVDTGPAVVSRKSAKYCGHTAAEKNAIVIDRFFETKAEAVAWTSAHPQFITVRVVPPENSEIAKRAVRQRAHMKT